MTPMPFKSGTIVVEGLKIFAYHGVFPQETMVGNMFEVSLSVEFNPEPAMRGDRVDLTINYAELIDIIKDVMAYPSKLIEHVCFRIYQNITHRFPRITGGVISIYKLQPPVSVELDRVGFVFRW